MNSAVFAINAIKSPSLADEDDATFLNSSLGPAPSQAQISADGLLNFHISDDVRALIALHDRGRFSAFEAKDSSYKALLNLVKYLRNTLGPRRIDGILPEVIAQAVKFVKSVPAEQVFLRLEVTDKKPDVPDFNPAHMCAYDAERSYGTDYLQIARRLTIHGSTSTVMANTDLGAFLERGKKKCVVLCMGTQKDDSIQFLDPAHSLALDLVVGGIENYETPDVLTEKVETLISHPELIQLHEEAAELQILLTEFKNNLNIEVGNDLINRLSDIKDKIADLSQNDGLIEFLAPVTEMTDLMLGDDLVHEMLVLRETAHETSAPTFPEIEDIHIALQSIINNQELSSEDKSAKILALLQTEIPSILNNSDITDNQVATYLEYIQTTLGEKGIPLTVPLVGIPQPWDKAHSERLAELLIYLQDPAQASLIKSGLEKTPEGLETLKLLETLAEKLDIQSAPSDTIITRIHNALTSPSAETAALASDLLHLMNFTSSSDLVALLPVPLQFTFNDFVRDTLPAQLGLATTNISETITRLSAGSIVVDFNPPHTLPEQSAPVALPFLAAPPIIEALSALPMDQLPQLVEALANPALKEQLQSNPKTAELITALETLRTQDGALPTDISLRLAELAASPDPILNAQAQQIIETLHTAATSPEVLAALPPEVQTLMTQVAETAFAATIPAALDAAQNTTTSPLATTLDTVQLPQLVEALADPALKEQLQSNPKTAELITALETLRTQDGALLQNTLSQPFGERAFKISSTPDLTGSFSSQSLPEIVSAQKIIERHLESLIKINPLNTEANFPDSPHAMTIKPHDILLGKMRSPSPSEQASLNIIAQHVKDHPTVLEKLMPTERVFVAAAVTKNVIDGMTGNMILPPHLQKEIKAALQSQNTDRIAQVISKAITTFPPNRLPPELSTLGIVSPYLMPRNSTNPSEDLSPVGASPKQHTSAPALHPQEESRADSGHVNPPSRPNDPITSQLPRNDNIQPPSTPVDQSPATKQAVCPVTGAEICLCDKFNEAAKNIKRGETLDMGNGVTAKVAEVKINEKGEEEKSFVIYDGDREIVTGTADTVQDFFRKNDEEIKNDFIKRFGEPTRNENPSPLPVTPPQTQPIIEIFENVNKPEENKDHTTPAQHDGDMDIDFGEDVPPLKTSSSTFSPR
ncbi:MAG: hypothetical protein WC043_04525 [Pseudobdellovibrionaceae bacterium]